MNNIDIIHTGASYEDEDIDKIGEKIDGKWFSPKEKYIAMCQFYLAFGKRSNGKTYGFLEKCLERTARAGRQFAYVRRFAEDIKSKRGTALFSALERDGKIKKWTDGKWTGVKYDRRAWWFTRKSGKDTIVSDEPFCWAFALNEMEHDKSASWPKIDFIFFDEFLARKGYLPDEFVLFENLISTIVRERGDVKIFMAGNTVTRYSPYWAEMGLTNIKKQQPGTIDVYKYGETELRVAVEYCESSEGSKAKASDVYFAFNNPKLNMITHGAWEFAMVPHAPRKWEKEDVKFSCFLDFDGELYQCDLIVLEDCTFLFWHAKTTPIYREDRDWIYSDKYDPRPNWHRNLAREKDNVTKMLYQYISTEKVYYSDNSVGDSISQYISKCLKGTL